VAFLNIRRDNMGNLEKAAFDIASKNNNQIGNLSRLRPTRLQPLPPLMQTPPTIVLGAANGSRTIVNAKTNDVVLGDGTLNPLYYYPGSLPRRADWDGVTYTNTGNEKWMAKGTVVKPHSNPGNIAVEFNYEGLEFELWEKGITGGLYQILVDEGQGFMRVFDKPQTASPSGGAMYYRKVTFSERKVRRIRLEYAGTYFGGVFSSPNDTVFPATLQNKIKFVGFGDSNVEGWQADSAFTGFIPMIGDMLGWETFISGSGGTGYVNPGTLTGRMKYGDRIQTDCINIKPDVVLIVGGNNDTNSPIEDVRANSLALYKQLKDSLPNSKIIIHGNMAKQNPPADTQIAVRDILLANAKIVGIPFIDTIAGITYDEKGNPLNAPTGNWFTGSGKVTNPQTSGNASIFVSSDGAHCSQAGYRYLAEKTTYEILKLLNS